MLGACVDGLFPLLLCFIMIENDIVYNLTVRENVISRYVKVFPLFYAYFSTFSVITFVFELITSSLTADL